MIRTIPLLAALMGVPFVCAAPAGFLTPAELKRALTHKTFVLINVHVPYEGRIAGTDLLLPYDTIGRNPQLPADRKTALVLYCRSGHMSAIARQRLNRLGYTHVRELQGGFDAWKAAGYALK